MNSAGTATIMLLTAMKCSKYRLLGSAVQFRKNYECRLVCRLTRFLMQRQQERACGDLAQAQVPFKPEVNHPQPEEEIAHLTALHDNVNVVAEPIVHTHGGENQLDGNGDLLSVSCAQGRHAMIVQMRQ